MKSESQAMKDILFGDRGTPRAGSILEWGKVCVRTQILVAHLLLSVWIRLFHQYDKKSRCQKE